MNNFSTVQPLLFIPSSGLEEEENFLQSYLRLLDDSGLEKLIKDWEKKPNSLGGRPSYNPYHLLSCLLLGYATGCSSLREFEERSLFDLRYIYLLEGKRPKKSTIANFINSFIMPNQEQIFSLVTKAILKELDIPLTDASVDGTKIEANANKYKFVWKPAKFHQRLSSKIISLLSEEKMDDDLPEEEILSSIYVAEKYSQLEEIVSALPPEEKKHKDKQLKLLREYLLKTLEYEEKEAICGPNRNSYYKTDHDATAMTLKTDYYSGLASNMHAAYNTQIIVVKGIICSYYVSQSRNDIGDLIPVLEKFKEMMGKYPKNLCADAGYGSLQNYRFLKNNGIENFVKHQSFSGNVSGRRPDAYHYNSDRTVTCLNGNIGLETEIPGRHPKQPGGKFYKVEGCQECAFSTYCKRYMKEKNEDFKIFEVSPEMCSYKNQSEENLLSPKGIEMRVNRSCQVEGAFGVIKHAMGFNRFTRTGMENFRAEMALMILGYNIRKYFKHLDGTLKIEFWKAPEGLLKEEKKKPSAKRLANKVNKRKEKTDNQKAKDNYKYKK